MSRPSGPRIRTIKPERYQDERMSGASRDARCLYDGLTARADDEGRGSANLALLRANVMPFDDDATAAVIRDWLVELANTNLIELYTVDGRDYYSITSWADDQRVDKPTPSRLPAPPSSAGDSSVSDSSDPLAIAREESRDLANVPALARDRGPGPGPGPGRGGAGERVREGELGEVLDILGQRQQLELDRVGVENAIAAWPGRDALQAARQVVTWAGGSDFKSTNAASLLERALNKQTPGSHAKQDEKRERTARRMESTRIAHALAGGKA